MNPILVAIERLGQHGTLLPALPVKPDGECIVVNRRFELHDENLHAMLAVTIFHRSFDGMEEAGAAVVECLQDGEDPWSFGEAEDVRFEKLGGDVTGYDEASRMYVRTIDFGVSW